jgi:hypothetical protein
LEGNAASAGVLGTVPPVKVVSAEELTSYAPVDATINKRTRYANYALCKEYIVVNI